jgi:peptidoglycan/LPS O-acetylase OafA/YrhL
MAATAVRAPVSSEKAMASRPRLAYVDNLRVLLITLVILVHMAITYGAPVGDWYHDFEEGPMGMAPAVLMTVFLAVCATFFMGLFFLLASYFLPGSIDRKGVRPYVVERLKRLGIPLVVYAVAVHPILEYPKAIHGGYVGGLPEFVVHYFQTTRTSGVGPLWFVEALLYFSLAYALWRYLAGPRPVIARRRPVPGNLAIALGALALGLATFALRIVAPSGYVLEPVHFQIANFPQYLALFALGIIAYRRGWLATLDAAQVRPWRWAIIPLLLALPILFVFGGAMDGNVEPMMGGLTWQSLVYAVWEQLMGAAIVLSLLVWFRDRLNGQNRLFRAIGGDTYAVYVCHPAVLVGLAVLLGGIQMDLALKFVLVAPVGVALSFLVGHVVRRLPLAKQVL